MLVALLATAVDAVARADCVAYVDAAVVLIFVSIASTCVFV